MVRVGEKDGVGGRAVIQKKRVKVWRPTANRDTEEEGEGVEAAR